MTDNKKKTVTFQTSFRPEIKELLFKRAEENGYKKVNVYLTDLITNNIQNQSSEETMDIKILKEEIEKMGIVINRMDRQALVKIYSNLQKILKNL